MGKKPSIITVRPFVFEDAEAVLAMMKEVAAFHDDEAIATASDVVRFASGAGRISTILVASLDDELCGFSATYDWMNYVDGFPVRNIDLFFVREGVRGNGVGDALLKQIARDAKSLACQRITVGAEPDNEGATPSIEGWALNSAAPLPIAMHYRVPHLIGLPLHRSRILHRSGSHRMGDSLMLGW